MASPLQNGLNVKPRKYEWLLVDADGTLFDYDRAESAALAQVFQRHEVRFQPEYVSAYRSINQQMWLELEQKLISPDALKVRRFERLLEKLGVSAPATRFSEVYLECLANCSELMDGAGAVVKRLQTQFKIAIITNGLQAVQRRRVERSNIRDYVSALIISEEIGHAKPAAEFFETAFKRIGQPAKDRVLVIGDDWSADIQGGADFGLDTCWYNPGRRARPASPALTYEIEHWEEVRALLGGCAL